LPPCCAKQKRECQHEAHGHHALQERGCGCDGRAAPELRLVGDHVGRDDGLAMARTCGVEDAVGEGKAEQAPER
jgi:hypothetical protein